MNKTNQKRPKAMSSAKAQNVKKQGHRDEHEFAALIGADVLKGQGKGDVVKGDLCFSLKGGKLKWQVFMYGKARLLSGLESDTGDNIGKLLAACPDAFPAERMDYINLSKDEKVVYKERLRPLMVAAKNYLAEPQHLRNFFRAAWFNGRVNSLVVKHDGKFHVFRSCDVLTVLTENTTVKNSQAERKNQHPEQKVLFKYGNPSSSWGEIEMRNDNSNYGRVKLWAYKRKVLTLLMDNITPHREECGGKVIVYGDAEV